MKQEVHSIHISNGNMTKIIFRSMVKVSVKISTRIEVRVTVSMKAKVVTRGREGNSKDKETEKKRQAGRSWSGGLS